MKSSTTIRPIKESDAPLIQKYVSDARVASTCNVPYPYSQGYAIEWIRKVISARRSRQRYTFTILWDDQLVGVVDLKEVHADQGTADLGYWIAVPFWNKGIATEAARQGVCFAFGELGLSSLSSRCLVRNPASARVLEKNGFSQVDEITDTNPESRFKGERWRVFQLTKSKWQRRKCEQSAAGDR